jgi:hypothetical protein
MVMQPKTSRQEQEGQFALRVVNPVGVLKFNPIPHAKRLKDLKNKKIGLYWNHKARGDVALERVKELLSERYQGMTFEWFETPVSVEASKEWFGQVKKSNVDGIVAATGD